MQGEARKVQPWTCALFCRGGAGMEGVMTDTGQKVLPALAVLGAGPAVILTSGPRPS